MCLPDYWQTMCWRFPEPSSRRQKLDVMCLGAMHCMSQVAWACSSSRVAAEMAYMVTCGKPDQDVLIGSEEHAGAITSVTPAASRHMLAATPPPRVQPNHPNISIHYTLYSYHVSYSYGPAHHNSTGTCRCTAFHSNKHCLAVP